MSEQCSGRIWERYRDYPCTRPAKVERGGRWYCGMHDPERPDKLAKAAKTQARYDTEVLRGKTDRAGGNLLRELSPADPLGAADALRELVAACRSIVSPVTAPLTGSDWHWATRELEAALAKLGGAS